MQILRQLLRSRVGATVAKMQSILLGEPYSYQVNINFWCSMKGAPMIKKCLLASFKA